jgi:glycosyltransferase involved in cell wall biosynthesis
VNGGLVNVDDVGSIFQRAMELKIIGPDEKLKRLKSARQKVVSAFDWEYVAKEHYSKVYKPLLGDKQTKV